MFDLFESLFGTTQSSTTSKVAPETVTRDTTTSLTTSSGSQPRRGRQQLRDRGTIDGLCNTTKHATAGLSVSQSCPPPISRSNPSNAKNSRNNGNHHLTKNSITRTTVNGKDNQRNPTRNATSVTTASNNHPSHRMDDAHYRDHSCPPSLSSTTTKQQVPSPTKTSQRSENGNIQNDSHRSNHNPSVMSNNKYCRTKKTKDLVSVIRNEPNRLAFLRMIRRQQQHRHIDSNKL